MIVTVGDLWMMIMMDLWICGFLDEDNSRIFGFLFFKVRISRICGFFMRLSRICGFVDF